MSSISQLEAEIANARKELQNNVEALTNYASPSNTAKRIKADALTKVAHLSNKANTIIERAQSGDIEAIKVLAAVLGVSALTIVLLLRKLFR